MSQVEVQLRDAKKLAQINVTAIKNRGPVFPRRAPISQPRLGTTMNAAPLAREALGTEGAIGKGSREV